MITGTTYYKLSPGFVEKELQDDKFPNEILIQAFALFGWDAFDMDYLEESGSVIIGDNLYLCVTDGQTIDINGREEDPFTALYDYDLNDLASYIQNGDDKNLKLTHRYLTTDELDPDLDLEEVVMSLLEEGLSFKDVYEAAKGIYFLNKE